MALVALRREGGAFLRRIGPVAAASSSRFFSAVVAEGWTLADEAADEEGAKQPVRSALDQMYCDLRFQKLAPSWLPFRPEDSFFIPPSPPLSKIIQELAHSAHSPITVHHLNFVLNPLGWTSSDAIHHRMAAHAEPSQDNKCLWRSLDGESMKVGIRGAINTR